MTELSSFEFALVGGGSFTSGEAAGESAGKAVGTAVKDAVTSYNLAKAAGWVVDLIESL
jgi:hypothetical protein